MFSEVTFPLHLGGGGKSSHLLAAELARRGHTVDVLSLSSEGPRRERLEGVEVHRVAPLDELSTPADELEAATARHLLAYVERELDLAGVDLVHDSGAFISEFFLLAYELRRRYGLPQVVHYRYLVLRHQAICHPQSPLAPLSAECFELEAQPETSQCFPARYADLVIAPSAADARFVAEAFAVPAPRLAVLPDPVDLDLHSSAAPWRREEWAPAAASLVLFGGRLDSDLKGPDLVLEAFRRIRTERDDVGLVLLAEDESVVEAFRRELGPAMISLGWIRDPRRLAGVFRAVDLVVVASRYESFGLMCAEALAAGTPVATTPVGAAEEMIDHGRNGWLLSRNGPRAWPEELAAAILEMASDPRRARRMGLEGRRYAERHLATERVVDRLEQLYGRLLDRRGRRTGLWLPEPGRESRERYLAVLEELAGPAVRAAGERRLGDSRAFSDDRCAACSRRRIGEDAGRLKRLGASGPDGEGGEWTGEVVRAVEAACPLSLVQKDSVRRLQREQHGDLGWRDRPDWWVRR